MIEVPRSLIENALKLLDALQYTPGPLVSIDNIRIRENYSGRGMYGKECFGFVGNIRGFAGFMVSLAVVECKQDLLSYPIKTSSGFSQRLAKSAQTDQLGCDQIFYFPGFVLSDD